MLRAANGWSLGLVSVLCVLALAGCGGSGATASGPAPAATSTPLPQVATMTIGILVPAKASPAPNVPAWAPNAQGLAIWLYPANGSQATTPSAVADLSSNGNCTSVGNNLRQCALKFTAPVGNALITATVYDRSPSSGKPRGNDLATTTVPQRVAAAGPNTLTFAIGGVPASFDVTPASVTVTPAPSSTASPAARSAIEVNVDARDQNGNVILTDQFANPVTVSVSGDANGTLSPQSTRLESPGDSPITFTYNGRPMAGQASITVGAANASSTSVAVNPH